MTTYYGTSGDDQYVNYNSTEPILAYGYGGNDRLLGGSDNDTLYGGAGNDYLEGNEGNNRLYGGAGNDGLSGRSGDDLLYGGAGDDDLFCGAGNDFLRGGAGGDIFWVGFFSPFDSYDVDISSVDTIADFSRNQGDKIIVSGSLSNYSLDQTQNISGTNALDTAIYYQNNLIAVARDTTQVSLLEDFIFYQLGTGGIGADDVLIGEAGADFIHGIGGNDTIYGGAGNDTLIGYYDLDVLYGGDGNDSLQGGSESDTLTGGAGADTFDLILGSRTDASFSQTIDTYNNDIITDFSHNQGDKIKLPGSISNYSLDQTQNISGGSGLDTVIYLYDPSPFSTSFLIAIIQDTTQVSLSSDFTFVPVTSFSSVPA